MCNQPNCSHDPLDDDFSDIFGEATPTPAPTRAPSYADVSRALGVSTGRVVTETRAAAHGHRYEEKCPDCRGTGSFYGYSGRYVGPCFKCKGKGVLTFKSSPEARAKAADARDNAKVQKAATVLEQRTAWAEANPAEWKWLLDGVKRQFEFAVSLHAALLQYGHFTEKQEAAIKRMTAESAERQLKWAQERAQREESASAIDITKIDTALRTALQNGLKWPKLRLDGFVFSPAGARSANAGAVYVKEGETYLGKIMGGRFSRSRDCSTDLEQRILAAAADPEKAAAAYGLQTGHVQLLRSRTDQRRERRSGHRPDLPQQVGVVMADMKLAAGEELEMLLSTDINWAAIIGPLLTAALKAEYEDSPPWLEFCYDTVGVVRACMPFGGNNPVVFEVPLREVVDYAVRGCATRDGRIVDHDGHLRGLADHLRGLANHLDTMLERD